MTLMTNFEVGDIPHSEYPRPQFVRDSFLCLNGKWDFAVAKKDCNSVEFNRKILVPFSPECLNSGINEQLLKDSNDRLYYKRKITVDEKWLTGVTVLHFGAVYY